MSTAGAQLPPNCTQGARSGIAFPPESAATHVQLVRSVDRHTGTLINPLNPAAVEYA